MSAYAFEYDKLNRMTLVGYGAGANSTTWEDLPGTYNEALTYDAMRNILTLQRNSANGLMDNLVYTYINGVNSNKLLSVTDNISVAGGFYDVNKPLDDYAYDGNGNFTTDKNKGLTINYNYLNLPKSVSSTQGTIDYTYNATGKKLVKKFSGQSDHNYFDGIEYIEDTMLFHDRRRTRASKYGWLPFLRLFSKRSPWQHPHGA